MSDWTETFFWNGTPVGFRPSETIAAALDRAGVVQLGDAHGHGGGRYFCGIGACQGCIVVVEGVRREACLTPARGGQQVRSIQKGTP
jgi:aerobic-type carbon monoxide dehydrogenase small subunit (CoxS/CutS family)